MSAFSNRTLSSGEADVELLVDHHMPHLKDIYTIPQRFSVVINGRQAGFPSGKKLLIYYGPQLKADITFNGSVVNKDLDVELEAGIYCNATGKYFGKNLGVLFDEKKGLIYIGKVKGLNGGSAYNTQKCYQQILEKLRDNRNPFVSKELNIFLDEVKFIENEIIFPSMNKLPCDIQVHMKELIEILNSHSELQHLETMFNEIAGIFKTLDVNKEYWDLLSMFLELNCVKQLSVLHCRKIVDYILKNANIDDICLLITQESDYIYEETLTEEKIFHEIQEKIDYFKEKYDEIRDDDISDWDLVTLISQILKTMPEKKNGLGDHLYDNENFFINKMLIFKNHLTHEILLKDYIKRYKKDESTIYIDLHSAAIKIDISSEIYNVMMNSKEEIGLLEYLNQRRMMHDICISNSSSFIDQGKYNLRFGKPRKGFFQKLKNVFWSESDQVKLIMLESGSKSYQIILVTDTIKNEYKSILIKENKTKQQRQYFTARYCDSNEKAIIEKNANFNIPLNKVNEMLRIGDYEDNSHRKMKQLKMIKQEREYIIKVLMKENSLLKRIINDYLKSKLTRLSDDIMSLPELDTSQINNYLQIIINRYRNEFEIEKSKNGLLKNIALRANYQLFVAKEKSVEVEQVMQLLSTSHVNLEELKNKDIVFLIGGTGSGKSTAACYLLGANMKLEESKFGEKIAKVVNNEKSFPIIGQSLCTSETLFCKGYAFASTSKARELILCDCPGFHDTRGSQYELCTHLSIDKTVKNAKSIKSILLIIPYSAFSFNRGKAIISEIQNLIDIFPDILGDNSLLQSVFFIISKADRSKMNLFFLREIISQNINEINLQIKTNANIKKYSENHIYTLGIWKTFEYLLDIQHVIVIDIRDKRDKGRIINAILEAPSIHKSKFSSTILSKEMMIEYGKLIEMSTHTWHAIIIPMYLQEIPSFLMEIAQKIQNSFEKITEIDINKANTITKIETLNVDLQSKNNKLRNLLALIKKMESKEINEDEINAFISSDENSNDLESKLKRKKDQLIEKLDQIEKLKTKNNLLQDDINLKYTDIATYAKNIEEANEEITKLSAGSTQECLYEFKQDPNDQLYYNTYDADEKNRAISECRYPVAERNDIHDGVFKNYKGKLYHHVLLRKNYRIVPRENQNEFFKGNNQVISDGRIYRAIIEGFNFQISGDPKGHVDGKLMIWPIKTIWQGREDKMPWFRIFHLLPNMDLNEATIINLNAEVNASTSEISKLGHEIKILEKNRNQGQQRIENFTKDYENEERLYEEHKNAEMTGSLESIKNRINIDIEDINREISSLEYQLESNAKEKEDLEHQITSLKIKQEETLERKKHLALLILKQIKSAEILYEFCQSIFNDHTNKNKSASDQTGMIKNCRKFMRMFSQKKQEIEARVKSDIFQKIEDVKQNIEMNIEEESKEEKKKIKKGEVGKS